MVTLPLLSARWSREQARCQAVLSCLSQHRTLQNLSTRDTRPSSQQNTVRFSVPPCLHWLLLQVLCCPAGDYHNTWHSQEHFSSRELKTLCVHSLKKGYNPTSRASDARAPRSSRLKNLQSNLQLSSFTHPYVLFVLCKNQTARPQLMQSDANSSGINLAFSYRCCCCLSSLLPQPRQKYCYWPN